MRNFRRNLLAEFIEEDERIQKLYRQIKEHPNHKREVEVWESGPDKKGEIMYYRHKVVIEMNITLGDESILILAHELMHYLLVLDGALLPIEIGDEISSETEGLKWILMKSITHHFLLKQKLDVAGFENLQLCFALRDEPHEMSSSYYHDEIFWLLKLYDNSTFAKKYNFVSLEERFEAEGMISVFELLQNSPKQTVQDINEISKLLIKIFNVEDSLQLVDLDDYTAQ